MVNSKQVVETSFLAFSLPVCLLTMITNTWAIVNIKQKNDQMVIITTPYCSKLELPTFIATISPPPQVIQGMIVLDCLNNMAFAALGTFQQSPRCRIRTYKSNSLM